MTDLLVLDDPLLTTRRSPLVSTNISWTDFVCNSAGGCSKVNKDCKGCWAEAFAERLAMMGNDVLAPVVSGGRWSRRSTGTAKLGALWGLMRRRAAARVFVCSMTDLFWSAHPDVVRYATLGAIAIAHPNVISQTLTKRPAEFWSFLERWLGADPVVSVWMALDEFFDVSHWKDAEERAKRLEVFVEGLKERRLPANWHFGVSVGHPEAAAEFLPLLKPLQGTRWVSAEPLIEPWNVLDYPDHFDWIVLGGESGGGARDCDVRGLVRMGAQARHLGAAVHIKQLGTNPVDGDEPIKLRHSHGGRIDEWPVWVPRWRDPAEMRPASADLGCGHPARGEG